MKTVLNVLWIFLLLSTTLWADDGVSRWYTQDNNKKVALNIELFLASTCPHCHKADDFFQNIGKTMPYLHVQRNLINEDKNALSRFNQLLSEQHMDDFAVPSIYFCNSRWVGFASAETTGKDLLHAINYCKQQIEKHGSLTPATVDTLRHWGNANKFDAGMVSNPSALSYITTIAITDAFSPCAFFGLAGFFAVLFLAERKNMRIKNGLVFALAVVLVHYWQQAHTSLFYEVFPWLRILAIVLGLLLVYFVVRHYKKQSTQFLLLPLAFFTGFIVTVYQQTCVMNWSFIFQQWLHNQQLSNLQVGLYQLLYQVLYIVPLLAILVLYVALFQLKRIALLQPRLLPIGLLYLLAIAACLIAYPLMLSYFTVSLLVFVILTVCGYFINWT